MVTMKDVAQLAGVSVSTVSIVVNNKAKERSIPLDTYNKVIDAASQLGYQPNVSARLLRNPSTPKPVIALYWPLDERTNILATLLSNIQLELSKNNFDCELIIQTYTNDKFKEYCKEIINNTYSGVIIGAASQSDIDYLESISTNSPIILINRKSEKYSTVKVNSTDVADQGVSLLLENSIKNVAVISTEAKYYESSKRISAFMSACKKNDISIDKDHTISVPNSYEGGIKAAEKYLLMKEMPNVIFCESDIIVLGMIYKFNRLNISVPDDVSIISIGSTSSSNTEYSTPSVTVIDIPSEEIVSNVISILLEKLTEKDLHNKLTPIHKKITPIIKIRDSFPKTKSEKDNS